MGLMALNPCLYIYLNGNRFFCYSCFCILSLLLSATFLVCTIHLYLLLFWFWFGHLWRQAECRAFRNYIVHAVNWIIVCKSAKVWLCCGNGLLLNSVLSAFVRVLQAWRPRDVTWQNVNQAKHYVILTF